MGTPSALLIISATLIVLSARVEGIPREILVEDDGGVVGGAAPIKTEEDPERLCHIEYQVMKRTLGRCVKFGRSATGCVSGTYLRPFHPECL